MTVALDDIKNAVQTDQGYAWGWQCNLAMPILDGSKGMLSHRGANVLAARLMAHLFSYDVTVLPEYKRIMGTLPEDENTGLEFDGSSDEPIL